VDASTARADYRHLRQRRSAKCDECCLDEDGKPDVESMDLITYDPVHHNYIKLGSIEGKAFADGKQIG